MIARIVGAMVLLLVASGAASAQTIGPASVEIDGNRDSPTCVLSVPGMCLMTWKGRHTPDATDDELSLYQAIDRVVLGLQTGAESKRIGLDFSEVEVEHPIWQTGNEIDRGLDGSYLSSVNNQYDVDVTHQGLLIHFRSPITGYSEPFLLRYSLVDADYETFTLPWDWKEFGTDDAVEPWHPVFWPDFAQAFAAMTPNVVVGGHLRSIGVELDPESGVSIQAASETDSSDSGIQVEASGASARAAASDASQQTAASPVAGSESRGVPFSPMGATVPTKSALPSTVMENLPWLIAGSLLLLPLLALLYSRIRRDRVLENATRRQVFESIIEAPGTTPAAVAKALGRDYKTVVHHVRRLRSAGRIDERRLGKSNHLFVNHGAFSQPQQHAIAGLQSESARRIAREVLMHSGLSQLDLAKRLHLAPSTVHHHVSQLEARGVLARTQNGNLIAINPAVKMTVAEWLDRFAPIGKAPGVSAQACLPSRP